MKKKTNFFGVKFLFENELPSKRLFYARTVFTPSYYIEFSSAAEVPVTIYLELKNIANRVIQDVVAEFWGMREDYHQKVIKFSSDSKWEIHTNKDNLGNFWHRVKIMKIKPKEKASIKVLYWVKTKPYKVEEINEFNYKSTGATKTGLVSPKQCLENKLLQLYASVMWILSNIKYEKVYWRLDPSSIARRGRGSCLSVSDLLVEMLSKCDIDARTVYGLYMDNPHAWVEVKLERFAEGIPVDILAGLVGAIGSIWISQHAETNFRRKQIRILNSRPNWIKSRYKIYIDYDAW